MPKVVYTSEQVTIAMALVQSGFPDSKVATYSGVKRLTVQALRLGRLKLGTAVERHDADVANRISAACPSRMKRQAPLPALK